MGKALSDFFMDTATRHRIGIQIKVSQSWLYQLLSCYQQLNIQKFYVRVLFLYVESFVWR